MCNLTSGGTTTQTNSLPDWAQGSIQSGLQGALNTYGSSTFQNDPGELAAAANPAMTNAAAGTQTLTGFQAPTVTAGSVANTNLSPYLNSGTQNVIDTTNSNINRQLGEQTQANDGQAAMSGAFGGDRAAVVNSQSQLNANQVMATTDANLEQQNFTNAENMASSDLNRGLQGQEANMQGAISSNAQDLQANQNLYNEGSGLTAVQQNADTLANQQFRAGQAYPIQMAQDATQAISQDSGVLGDELTRQTIAPNASTLGTVTGLTTAATGLAGLLGGSSGLSGLLGTSGGSSNSGLLSLLGLGGGAANAAASSGALSGVANSAAGLDGAAQTAASGYGSFSNIVPSAASSGDSSGIGSDIFGDDLDFKRGGRVGYADGGLVDDPGYVPVGATDGMMTMDQQGNVLTPYQERTNERFATPGSMMPLPSTSAATSDGQGFSQDQSSYGALGLEGARVGYADGGDVDGQWVPSPDGGLVFLPNGTAPAQSSGGLAAAAPPAVNLQTPTQPAVPPSAALTGYDQYQAPQPDGSPSAAVPDSSPSAAVPTDGTAPAPAPAPDAASATSSDGTPAPSTVDGGGVADPGSGIAAAILGPDGQPTGPAGIAGDILGAGDPGSPPAAGAAPSGPTVDRLQRSADPGAPLPGGQSAPGGLAGGASPQPPAAMGPQTQMGQGKGGAPGGPGNSWALPVLAAGLGMLSNAGPNAAKMIGGGLAGVQVIEQQRDADLRRQQMAQQMAYQNGMLGVRNAQVDVNQQKADTGVQRANTQDQVATARIQQLQSAAQLALARAQKAASGGNNVTAAQLKQNAIQDLINQGVSPSDAYSSVSGLTIRQQQADASTENATTNQDRLKQQGTQFDQRQGQQADEFNRQQALRQQQADSLNVNRQQQAQQHASDEEDRGARSLMYAASNAGKTLSYQTALQQVRSTRSAAGPAPVQGPIAQQPAGGGAPAIREGATATGPGGARMVYQGGSWQPMR